MSAWKKGHKGGRCLPLLLTGLYFSSWASNDVGGGIGLRLVANIAARSAG